MRRDIELRVNGEVHSLSVEEHRSLAEVLRNDLGLTGVKQGCGAGDCGVCTVLLDDEPVNSCLLLACEAEGGRIETIESLFDERLGLHPVQQAFVELGAVQCGYCTPGMIISAVGLLRANPSPSREEIVKALSGNICRCTGYQKIIDAVVHAAASMAQSSAADEEAR